MRLARLYQKLHCEPLMLSEDAFTAFAHALQAHMAAGPLAAPAVRPIDPAGTDATSQDYLDYYRRGRATMEQIRVEEVLRKYGPVAVVQIHGAIDRNLSRMEIECYGACDLQDINAALDECAADAAIQTVILDFDTPGGNCVGHAETAAHIVALRQTRNVVAWIGGQCHSLGVYLAVHCDHIIIGASAWMGSIGVRCARLDMTKALAAQGITITNFASSDEKTDFASSKPLTVAEAARIQARVDMLYADFCAVVRAGRPGMSEEFFKAQIFFGQEAIDAGLADEMATSLDEVASEFLASAAVYASNPGSGSTFFDSRPARAEVGQSFEARSGGAFLGAGDFDPSKHPRESDGQFSYANDAKSIGSHFAIEAAAHVIAHAARHAFEAIHRVHSNGDLTLTKSKVTSEMVEKDTLGEYNKRTNHIAAREGKDHPIFTLVHELGHAIHHLVLGDYGAGNTKSDFSDAESHDDAAAFLKKKISDAKAMGAEPQPAHVAGLAVHKAAGDLFRALNKTSEVKNLKKVRPGTMYFGNVAEKQTSHEIFARAYSQHIAQESQHPALLAGLAADRNTVVGKYTQWSPDSFRPVGEAFTALLRAKGWIKTPKKS